MLVALGCLKIRQSARQGAKETDLSHARISRAFFVIEHAPDQAELLLSGGGITPPKEGYCITVWHNKDAR
jgi:hypothetical protein